MFVATKTNPLKPTHLYSYCEIISDFILVPAAASYCNSYKTRGEPHQPSSHSTIVNHDFSVHTLQVKQVVYGTWKSVLLVSFTHQNWLGCLGSVDVLKDHNAFMELL